MPEVKATGLKKGMCVKMNNDLYIVLSTMHITPGNWRGMVQSKLRNLRSGNQMDHRFRSEDMVERINERLGRPDRCPHGWPVEPDVEQAENRQLAALSELEPGTIGEIVRLAEHDGDLLHWFYDEGFVPGTRVELQEAQPAAGQLKVRLNGADRAIAERAAAGLYVRATA